MKLATVADFKILFSISGTNQDTLIGFILDKVTARIESYCRRTFLDTGSDVTEYPAGGISLIEPKQFPLVSVTAIYEDSQRLFPDATLVDPTYYYVRERIIERIGGRFWANYPGGIKLLYRGGYQATAGVYQGIPDDLQMACLTQAGFIFQRRLQMGLSGITGGDGSIQTLQKFELISDVVESLQKYRRGLI